MILHVGILPPSSVEAVDFSGCPTGVTKARVLGANDNLGLYNQVTLPRKPDGSLDWDNIGPHRIESYQGGEARFWRDHVAKVIRDMDYYCPDPNFDGVFYINYEPWFPYWNGMNPPGTWQIPWEVSWRKHCDSKYRSKLKHLSEDEREQFYRVTFLSIAREMFIETINAVKRARPKAQVGVYEMPRAGTWEWIDGRPHVVQKANDDMLPCIRLCDVLMPSMYNSYRTPDPRVANQSAWKPHCYAEARRIQQLCIKPDGDVPSVMPFLMDFYMSGERLDAPEVLDDFAAIRAARIHQAILWGWGTNPQAPLVPSVFQQYLETTYWPSMRRALGYPQVVPPVVRQPVYWVSFFDASQPHCAAEWWQAEDGVEQLISQLEHLRSIVQPTRTRKLRICLWMPQGFTGFDPKLQNFPQNVYGNDVWTGGCMTDSKHEALRNVLRPWLEAHAEDTEMYVYGGPLDDEAGLKEYAAWTDEVGIVGWWFDTLCWPLERIERHLALIEESGYSDQLRLIGCEALPFDPAGVSGGNPPPSGVGGFRHTGLSSIMTTLGDKVEWLSFTGYFENFLKWGPMSIPSGSGPVHNWVVTSWWMTQEELDLRHLGYIVGCTTWILSGGHVTVSQSPTGDILAISGSGTGDGDNAEAVTSFAQHLAARADARLRAITEGGAS